MGFAKIGAPRIDEEEAPTALFRFEERFPDVEGSAELEPEAIWCGVVWVEEEGV